MPSLSEIVANLDAACEACDVQGKGGSLITPHQREVDEERKGRDTLRNLFPLSYARGLQPPLDPETAKRWSRSLRNAFPPAPRTYTGGYRGSRFASCDMKRKTFHSPPGTPPVDQDRESYFPPLGSAH